MENLQALLARSDYISLHVPAMDATKHLINDAALALTKPGAVLLNFARETIVDSAAVKRSFRCWQTGQIRLRLPRAGFAEPPPSHRHAAHRCQHRRIRRKLRRHGRQPADGLPGKRQYRQLGQLPGCGHGSRGRNDAHHLLQRQCLWRVGPCVVGLGGQKSQRHRHDEQKPGELAFNIIDVESKPADDVIAAIAAVEHVIRVRVI